MIRVLLAMAVLATPGVKPGTHYKHVKEKHDTKAEAKALDKAWCDRCSTKGGGGCKGYKTVCGIKGP